MECGVVGMELKDVSKAALKEGADRAKKELANEEIEFAKRAYREAKSNIDALDAEIKLREEKKKPWLKVLEQFK
jgi:hypothetical protein